MEPWSDILPAGDLSPGEVREIEFEGEDLLLYRLANGEIRATSAWCPHMRNYMPNGLPPGASLSALLKNDTLTCPFHGWQFDGSGHCTRLPPGQRVPPRIARGDAIMPSWPVRELDGSIQIGPKSTPAARR